MQTKERGILLQRPLHQQSCFTVFSSERGKIALTILDRRYGQRLHPGSLFTFVVRTSPSRNHLATCCVDELVPLVYHHPTDIFWFHHLLELCSAFSPEYQPNSDVFDFLADCITLLATHDKAPDLYYLQCLCRGVLMWLLGFHPPEKLINCLLLAHGICKHRLYRVDTPPPHPLASLAGNSDTKELDVWIVDCIQSHPQASTFKTSELLRLYHPQKSEDDHENT
ncbi:MAG: hypothetical protein WCW33_06470 [Candidatus Babeliales bacterium]